MPREQLLADCQFLFSSAEQEFNRTEGDGTDSPIVASPPRDYYKDGRYPASPNQSFSPRMPRSPVKHYQAYNGSRMPDSRATSMREPPPPPQWSQPAASPPYVDGWQVRDHFDEDPVPAPSYRAERLYTPPLQGYHNSMSPHSAVPPPTQNVEYYDPMASQDFDSQQHPSYRMGAPANAFSYQTPGQGPPTMAPHHPVHSQPYRVHSSSSYNPSYKYTNNNQPNGMHPLRMDLDIPGEDPRVNYGVKFSAHTFSALT